MKHDASGRQIIAAPWTALSEIPALVTQLAGLADPGQDALLLWDDSLGALDWIAAGPIVGLSALTDPGFDAVLVWDDTGSNMEWANRNEFIANSNNRRARCNASGTLLASSAGITASVRTGVGVFQFTFSPAFATTPMVQAIAESTHEDYCHIAAVSTTSVTVNVRGSGGSLLDPTSGISLEAMEI